MPGIMTRDQIVTEICDIVGKSVSGAAVSGTTLQSRVQNYLNFSQRRIARFYSFEELNITVTNLVTVANQKTYTFDSLNLTGAKDIHSVIIVDGANSRRLKRWSYNKIDKRVPDPTQYTTGRPSIYISYAKTIELFRIPDAIYSMTIRYPQWPTAFTSASQVSDFDNKDEILICAGVMETYLALEEYNDAAVWYQKTIAMLRDAKESDDADVDWEPHGEGFVTDHEATILGTPWADPGGEPGDPLYGYLG